MQENPLKGILSVVAVALIAILILQFAPYEIAQTAIREHGPIEVASVLTYIYAAIVAFFVAMQGRWQGGYLAGTILMLFASRELDYHVKFTTMNFAKTRFFISHKVPMIEKVIVTFVLLAILYLVISFLKNNWSLMKEGLSKKSAIAYTAIPAMIMMPFTKILDSTPKILRDHFHLPITPELRQVTTIVEEVFELAIPALFLLALMQFYFAKKKA